MRNSREEDIKLLEEFSNENVLYGSTVGMTLEKYKDLQLSTEHILSDYKRLLKENESLKEYNMEYKRILDLADDRIYRKKYLEERRKEQPNLLYPDADEIYQRYYELKQENEELKNENRRLKVIRYSTEYGTENIHLITKSDLVQIDINKYMIEIEKGKFVDLKQIYQENKELKEKYATFVKMSCEIVEQSILVQEVKDKIEEYKNMLKTCNRVKDIDRIKAINERILELQELIEGRK